jgi:hypothetical protein
MKANQPAWQSAGPRATIDLFCQKIHHGRQALTNIADDQRYADTHVQGMPTRGGIHAAFTLP